VEEARREGFGVIRKVVGEMLQAGFLAELRAAASDPREVEEPQDLGEENADDAVLEPRQADPPNVLELASASRISR
jgi:hypothetical protein